MSGASGSSTPRVASTTKFQNVLFCPLTDRGNAAATRRVLGVLGDGSTLKLTAVVPEPTRFQQILHGSDHVDAVLEDGHRSARRRLDRCAAVVRQSGRRVDVSSVVDVGHPALTLLTRAIGAGHDLLVVSVDDAEDRALVRRLLRKSPCPVWVVRQTRASKPRVLAAIDPEPEDEGTNLAILDAAAGFAGAAGELHVVNAWQMFGESSMRSSAFMHVDDDEVDRRRQSVKEAHERAVTELIGTRADCDRWQVHVVGGAATDVIGDLIDRHHINNLVIGTVARSGLGGLVMGNTAEHIVDEVTCSVVAIKPPGFVSPIHF